MNIDRLLEAEALFLQQYPGGFEHPDLVAIGKKHNVNKMTEHARATLNKSSFKNTATALENLIKTISRSSMVSMFEKPKFRDYVNGLSRSDRAALASAFAELMHGKREQGFEAVVDILAEGQLAKWSLLTICPMYYHPQKEVFVKPTTTKGVIRRFELDHLEYKPRPSWVFYRDYRAAIDEMKAIVNPALSPNNAAFTGFLMMTTGSGGR